MDKNMVFIPVEIFQEILKKAEQRDIILRFAEKESYSVSVSDIFKICACEKVKKEDAQDAGKPDAG